jgi:single-strand DNA-binding protein
MAGYVNKVILIGRLGRDPEARTTQAGMKTVSFSIATSETWNDKASGERKEKTQWHRIVIFNDRIADVAEKYLKKGSMVYIEGQIESRKYTDKDGQEREITEIVIGRFKGELTLLDSRGSGGEGGEMGGGGGYAPRERAAAPARAPARSSGSPSWDSPKGGDLDDDIPF